MLNITNHQEMKINTTMRYHLTPTRITIIKKKRQNKTRKQKITGVGEDVEKLKSLHNVGGNAE